MLPHRLQLRRRGFTLIEILVTVVILGIASAIIIPQIGSRDDLVASAGARSLMADLMYAQNRAIAMQQPHYVWFSGQQYTVSNNTNMTAITNPITKNNYVVTFGTTGTALENVAVGTENFGGKTVLEFDELGSPQAFDISSKVATPLVNSGTIVITAGNASLTINVEPYTGELTVAE